MIGRKRRKVIRMIRRGVDEEGEWRCR